MSTAALKRDNPVVRLEEKFKGWVMQQPEWLAIVAMPRPERRAAMKELASRLYTIPTMDGVNTVPRQTRRMVERAVQKQVEQVQEALAARALLLEAAASTALDGETQAVEEEPTDFEGTKPVIGFIEDDRVVVEEEEE